MKFGTWGWKDTSTVRELSCNKAKDARCEPHVQSTRQAARREEFNAGAAEQCDHAFRPSPKGFKTKEERKQNCHHEVDGSS